MVILPSLIRAEDEELIQYKVASATDAWELGYSKVNDAGQLEYFNKIGTPITPFIAQTAPLTSSASKALVHYQAVVDGPWLLGTAEIPDTGAIVFRDGAGSPVTPVDTRTSLASDSTSFFPFQYQAAADTDPWLLGYGEKNTGGALVLNDAAGNPITPFDIRLGAGSTTQQQAPFNLVQYKAAADTDPLLIGYSELSDTGVLTYKDDAGGDITPFAVQLGSEAAVQQQQKPFSLIEYQAVADGSWLRGYAETSDTGAITYKDATGADITPVDTRSFSAVSTEDAEYFEYQLTDAADPWVIGRVEVSEADGSLIYRDEAGTVINPFNKRLSPGARERWGFTEILYNATTAEPGISVGDDLRAIKLTVATADNIITTTTQWENVSTGALLATPPTSPDAVADDVEGLLQTQNETIDAIASNVAIGLGPALSAVAFQPLQVTIPAGFAMPAVGVTVDVDVSNRHEEFIAGDTVIVTELADTGLAVRFAWFEVTARSVQTLTLQAIARDGAANDGEVFAAGCEITGQTRLPSVPGDANFAEVVVSTTEVLDGIALDSTAPMYDVAKSLSDGQGLAYAGLRFLTDIDLSTEYGQKLADKGVYKVVDRADLARVRLVSNTPLALLPAMKVVYR